MSVNYNSPVAIPQQVAMGVQSLLSGLNAFSLTEDNFVAFVARNQEFGLVMWKTDTDFIRPATAEELRPLIGFSWH